MDPVYVSDLDGTLLRRDARLSDYTRDRLLALLDEGIRFTVATARGAATVRPMFEGISIRMPTVTTTGAFLTDLTTGEVLAAHGIGDVPARSAFEHLVRRGHTPLVSTFDGESSRLSFTDDGSAGAQEYLAWRRKMPDANRVGCAVALEAALDDQVICFTLVERQDVVEELSGELHERLDGTIVTHLFPDMYLDGWHWLTVFGPEATKEAGLARLVERERLHGHELVVFGDTETDAGMFRMAGRAVAVENACDGLKRHATQVIGHHESDAVIRWIEDDFRRAGG